jgi:hypothetical protein
MRVRVLSLRTFPAKRRTQPPERKRSFRSALVEERELGLALAAKDRKVHLHASNTARVCERTRLRFDALRRKDALALAVDAFEITAELLDGFDGGHALDLDGNPGAILVA